MEITIHQGGMQTTVQDLGRAGSRASGVPLGGAIDAPSLRLANLLVGNEENTPALEMTLVGPEISFSEDAVVALVGANFPGMARGRTLLVKAGEVIAFGAVALGCRAYFAVAGGFAVAEVLGGRGTYLRAEIGGHEGRALQKGDVIAIGAVADTARLEKLKTAAQAGSWWIDPKLFPPCAHTTTVRVIRGAQAGEFSKVVYRGTFKVSVRSDRMGLRLEGPKLHRHSDVELVSTGVAPGTIQVPSDGQPIVLLADAQTLGGYPRIAHVITADLPLMGQLRPGDSVRFTEVTLEEAQRLAQSSERVLALVREGIARKFL